MSTGVTSEIYPTEYAQPPVYGRLPSIEAIERMQKQARLTPAQALTEITAAVRATL